MINFTIIASNGRWQINETNKIRAIGEFKKIHPYAQVAFVEETDKALQFLNYDECNRLINAGLTKEQIFVVDQIIGNLKNV